MEKEKTVVEQDDLRGALELKKMQDKIRKRFEFLNQVDAQHFQQAYIKAQAEEICNYLKFLRLTPFKAWYGILFETISDPSFLYDYYITKNEFEEYIPDEDRLSKLVLQETPTEDFPKEREL